MKTVDNKFDADMQCIIRSMMFHTKELSMTRSEKQIRTLKVEKIKQLITAGHLFPWWKRYTVSVLGETLIHCANCDNNFLVSTGGNLWICDYNHKFITEIGLDPGGGVEIPTCTSYIIKDIVK